MTNKNREKTGCDITTCLLYCFTCRCILLDAWKVCRRRRTIQLTSRAHFKMNLTSVLMWSIRPLGAPQLTKTLTMTTSHAFAVCVDSILSSMCMESVLAAFLPHLDNQIQANEGVRADGFVSCTHKRMNFLSHFLYHSYIVQKRRKETHGIGLCVDEIRRKRLKRVDCTDAKMKEIIHCGLFSQLVSTS